jgi:MFS family permease
MPLEKNLNAPYLTPFARRYAMFILAVVYMFNFVDRQILSILLPAIRDEFQVGDTVLGLLAGTAFALFYVALGVPIGQLADRVNRRNLVAASVAIWSAMTALSGLAANVWYLALARVGVGIGEAGCSPPAHSTFGRNGVLHPRHFSGCHAGVPRWWVGRAEHRLA